MTLLPTRRHFGVQLGAVALLLCAGLAGGRARAQGADPAAFMKQFADQMTSVVNGSQPLAAKQAALQPVIDGNVDVADIAKFCLARAWSSASQTQQQQYVAIFHQVLMKNITSHLGEYQGVSFSFGTTSPQGANTVVQTTVTRPNAPTANIGWVVSMATGAPKVIDVLAEGTSLRLQQRDDYQSYLRRHNNDIDALIAALQRQVSGG